MNKNTQATVTKSEAPNRYYLKIEREDETVFYNLIHIEGLGEILNDEAIEYDQLKGDLSWSDIYFAREENKCII